MPILRIIKRKIDQELYDAASAEMNLDREHPLGLIMHGAVEVGDTMEIAQVWEAEDYARRYDEEHLEPALRAVGATLDAEVSIYELHHLITP